MSTSSFIVGGDVRSRWRWVLGGVFSMSFGFMAVILLGTYEMLGDSVTSLGHSCPCGMNCGPSCCCAPSEEPGWIADQEPHQSDTLDRGETDPGPAQPCVRVCQCGSDPVGPLPLGHRERRLAEDPLVVLARCLVLSRDWALYPPADVLAGRLPSPPWPEPPEPA